MKSYKNDITAYIQQQYGISPEFLWQKFPDYAVFRQRSNRKWFAVIMKVPAVKLGLEGNEAREIINLKSDPYLVGSLRQTQGFLPAYHMNKENWVSILLDGAVKKDEIEKLIDYSYQLTLG